MNLHIEKEGDENVGLVSEEEFWRFWGIIFAACPCGKGGKKLFGKESFPRHLLAAINFGRDGLGILSWARFKQVYERIHFAFYDAGCPEDPWHPIGLLLDGYNDNRREKLAASIKIVLDESMSAFQPRTTKLSMLPFLSFVFRKPKPLGTEYKVRSHC